MTDINSSPVSLGAGGFDYEDLKTGLDAAAAAPADKYDGAVRSTIENLDQNKIVDIDPRFIADHEFVEVDREIGDETVTESVQVYTGGAAAMKAELADAKGKKPDAVSTAGIATGEK